MWSVRYRSVYMLHSVDHLLQLSISEIPTVELGTELPISQEELPLSISLTLIFSSD